MKGAKPKEVLSSRERCPKSSTIFSIGCTRVAIDPDSREPEKKTLSEISNLVIIQGFLSVLDAEVVQATCDDQIRKIIFRISQEILYDSRTLDA